MQIASEIFREYDIRGIFADQAAAAAGGAFLTTDVARALGRAVGSQIRAAGKSRVVVGRDNREHGKILEDAFADGLTSTGCDALLIGVTPTPVNYWAIKHLEADGGVQITGSHNPPEYNGFKLTLLGKSLYGAQIQELREIIVKDAFASGQGAAKDTPVLDAYVDDVVRLLKKPGRKLKVVVDGGNGVGGITAMPVLTKLGYDIIPLFIEPDSKYPNHHPDPTVEKNLKDLKAAVKEHGADVGIAFDGDADRIGAIDKNGDVIWGDRLMILLSRAVLAESPGASIIGEVKCSKTLYDDIAKHGGKPIMWRTGHSLIKEKMKESGAELAGEMSGHIFFKHRYYGFDDATYTAGRLLEILSHGEGSIGERLKDVPDTAATPEIRYDVTEATKFPIIKAVTERFKARQDGSRVIDIDGARVEWGDGWGLVRASNTTPILVMRFEAQSASRAAEIQKLFEQELASVREELGA